MLNVKTKVAGLVLAVGVAGGLMAAPAFGSADLNDNGKNCHGVIISGLSGPIGGNPAQVAKFYGATVQEVQDFIKTIPCTP